LFAVVMVAFVHAGVVQMFSHSMSLRCSRRHQSDVLLFDVVRMFTPVSFRCSRRCRSDVHAGVIQMFTPVSFRCSLIRCHSDVHAGINQMFSCSMLFGCSRRCHSDVLHLFTPVSFRCSRQRHSDVLLFNVVQLFTPASFRCSRRRCSDILLFDVTQMFTPVSFRCPAFIHAGVIQMFSRSIGSDVVCSKARLSHLDSSIFYRGGEFHDEGDAKWIVFRGQLRGHNGTPFGRPTPGRPIGRPVA
jgi:hypothetical protein